MSFILKPIRYRNEVTSLQKNDEIIITISGKLAIKRGLVYLQINPSDLTRGLTSELTIDLSESTMNKEELTKVASLLQLALSLCGFTANLFDFQDDFLEIIITEKSM